MVLDLDELGAEDASPAPSHFALLGVGPEPDAEEILTPIHQVFGVEIPGGQGLPEDGIPTPEHPLTVLVGDDAVMARVWVSDVDGLIERLCHDPAAGSEGERRSAAASDWVLHLLVWLEGDDPFALLRLQLRLVELMRSVAVRQVADCSALRLWSPQDVTDLQEIPVRPPMTDLYSLHLVPAAHVSAHCQGDSALPHLNGAPRPRTWAHTHGLARFGIPDVEAFSVPTDHLPTVTEAFEAVIERVIDHPTAMERPFPLCEGARGALVPVDDLLDALPDDDPASDPAIRGLDESMAGPRCALLALYEGEADEEPRLVWDLSDVLERVRAGGVYRAASDSARMRSLARHRLPLLHELWQDHRADEWRLLVKSPISWAGPEHHEQVWFEVTELGADPVAGQLLSPSHLPDGVDPVDEAPLALSSVSAFLLVTPERRWGPAHLPELARQLKGKP